jgi:hypothetical protein
MDLKNTTLDDLAAVIGFSATLRLAAWYGDGTSNMFVPKAAEEGHILVKLVGHSNAQRLSEAWPQTHIAIPRLSDYEDDVRKRIVGRMFEKGFGSREIAGHLRISERRVQQICRELETVGLIPVQGPGKMPHKNAPGIAHQEKGGGTGPGSLPAAFFGKGQGVGR